MDGRKKVWILKVGNLKTPIPLTQFKGENMFINGFLSGMGFAAGIVVALFVIFAMGVWLIIKFN